MQRRLLLLLLLIFPLSAHAEELPFSLAPQDIKHARAAFEYVEKDKKSKAFEEAAKAPSPLVLALVKWEYYTDNREGITRKELQNFITNHPGWPLIGKLEQNVEDMLDGSENTSSLIPWFRLHPPKTAKGKWYLATAYEKAGIVDKETITKLIRDAWVNGDFNTSDEKNFLARHKDKLRQEDHIKRTDRLLYREYATIAKRMLPMVPKDYQALFAAEIAMTRNQNGIEKLFRQIPSHLRNDPGLMLARMRWRERHKDYDGVQELLLKLPETLPYPEQWWSLIRKHTRLILEEKRYQDAYRIISRHSQTNDANKADANWTAGWIALRFLHKPERAFTHFADMYEEVSFPMSLSRAAYWAGRAKEAASKMDEANSWYRKAAKYPTTFYGQLAHHAINENIDIVLPSNPPITNEDRARYAKNELAYAAYLLVEIKQVRTADTFVEAAIDQAKSKGEMALIAHMGLSIKEPSLAVEAASRAYQYDLILPYSLYPTLSKMPDIPVEPHLAMSIIRQESHFNYEAFSSAGAAGLMQLMPATAQHIAKKIGVRYRKEKLRTDPTYNVLLGSHYIGELLESFDGSYILAIAAYNGGPGNVNKWLKQYGDPRKLRHLHDLIDWIEMIPFSETRNYVQRVLEGKQVYQMRLTERPLPAKRLIADLWYGTAQVAER
jgi:soluble lytic murein transglycosylase